MMKTTAGCSRGQISDLYWVYLLMVGFFFYLSGEATSINRYADANSRKLSLGSKSPPAKRHIIDFKVLGSYNRTWLPEWASSRSMRFMLRAREACRRRHKIE